MPRSKTQKAAKSENSARQIGFWGCSQKNSRRYLAKTLAFAKIPSRAPELALIVGWNTLTYTY